MLIPYFGNAVSSTADNMLSKIRLEEVFDLPVDAGVVAVNMLVIVCGLYTVSMKVETGYVCWSLCHSEMRIQQQFISHNLQYCGRSNNLLLGDLTF